MSSDSITVGYADEQWQIPREIYQSGKAKQHIQQLIADREAKAAADAKAASAEAMAGAAMQKQLIEMQQLMEAQQAQLAQLQAENEKLRTLSPDAAAGAMALMNATAEAQRLRTELHKDLTLMERFKSDQLADVGYVAEQMKRDARANDEARKAKLAASREYLEHLRNGGASVPAMEQQSLPVVIEPEGGVAT